MRANLHLHSRFSDGTIWPSDIAKRAAAMKLKIAALTDHDTLSGTAEFAEEGKDLGIRTVAGVEIDCREPSIAYKSELLAYFPSGRCAWTAAFLDEIKKDRVRSAQRAIKLAADHFDIPDLAFSDLLARKRADREPLGAENFSFNKVDVFQYLRDQGAIPYDMDYKSFKRAYFDTRILSNGGRDKPLCSDIASVVGKDGGVLVVPHIGHEFGDDFPRMKKERNRLGELLEYFKSIGVAGVELYQYREEETDEMNRLVRKIAKPLGFFFTYGSDCHGPASGKDTIETFSGDFAGFPEL